MKKVHSINREALRLLTTALLLFVVCVVANAYDFRVDGIYYKVLDATERTCEVTYLSTSNSNYSAYQGSVVIQNTVEYDNVTYAVKGINDSAFEGCTALTEITIPNSVTEIGNRAFYGCTGLTSITIPNSVTSIGEKVFYNCKGLTSATIGNSVTSIGSSAFYGCTKLTEVNIPNSVTTIGSSAFSGCWGLTEVTIGNSVTTIGSSAFDGCSGLTGELIIPNSVTEIGGSAFSGCSGLTEVTIGENVTSIGEWAFYGSSKLVGITSLNQKPPTCGSQVFYNVDSKTCILYVPEGSLGAYANASTWRSFYNIVEIEVDAIADITTNGNAEAVGYYTTDGKQVSTLQRGINVIRYSDGTVKKVLVK